MKKILYFIFALCMCNMLYSGFSEESPRPDITRNVNRSSRFEPRTLSFVNPTGITKVTDKHGERYSADGMVHGEAVHMQTSKHNDGRFSASYSEKRTNQLTPVKENSARAIFEQLAYAYDAQEKNK